MSEGDERPRPRLSGRRDRWPGQEPARQEASRRTASGREEAGAAADRGADAAGEARQPPPGAAEGDGEAVSGDAAAGNGPG